MKKFVLAIAAVFLVLTQLRAQYTTVIYDYEKNRFGENQLLPAESPIIFSGLVPPGVDLVEIQFFSAKGKEGRDAQYTAIWKRPFNKQSDDFNLPVNYPLRASKKYDIQISFFRQIVAEEKDQVYEHLVSILDNYLDQTFEFKNKGIKLGQKTARIMGDMNQILETGLSRYRNKTEDGFASFSDIVRQQLDRLESGNYPKAKSEEEKEKLHEASRQKRIDDLKAMVHSEVRTILNDELVTLRDSRYIDDYLTEDRSTWFALNLGYGGVYIDGKVDELNSFGDSPYLGIGFPLSTSRIAPKFLQDASLTMGVFTRNFKNDAGDKITGPIFGIPLYAGLDYKLFSFIRVNAGATLLEKDPVAEERSDIFIRPFIGISAKVNISLSLDK